MSKANILVVDDDPGLRTLLKNRLVAVGYQVTLTEGGPEALARAEEELFDLALVDLKMEEMDGFTVLEKLLRIQPNLPVFILTAHGGIPDAVQATKKGAYDFLSKPFDPKDFLHRLEQALEMRRLRGEVERLHSLVQERYEFDHIIAASDKMQEVLRQVAQVAATDSTICIFGESGTGKELIAKALHVASQRAQGPFVVINCGAIPEHLLENELFGHTRGAYTGADRAKRGLVQQAARGTLFLDEIGDMPPSLQVKLLRVLQEREFMPLGAESPVQTDFRLVVATNRDLIKLIAEGKFREDLYYRIHVIPLFLPPLRERPEDITPLAQHFVQRFSREMNKEIEGFTPEALRQLAQYAWPGNVRELANVVERAIVLTTRSIITPDLLLPQQQEVQQSSTGLAPLKEARQQFEKGYLVQILTMVNGNVARAAELAGRDRTEFYKLLHKHTLDPGAFKTTKAPVG